MSLKQALAANRWLRAQFACLIAVVLCLPAMVVFASAWVFLAFVAFAVVGGVCWVPAHRVDEALEAARVAAAAEAREPHTLRVPEAGRAQCPVCGMDDLDQLAADDKLMERGPDRSKVVAYGRRRAHRDCAEFVPYVAPPAPIGAHYTCRFCGDGRQAPSMAEAEARLIVHSKTCPKRPAPAKPILTGKLRASVIDAYIRETEAKLAQIDLSWMPTDPRDRRR